MRIPGPAALSAIIVLAAASPAAASTVQNPIVAPSLGGVSIGAATLTVTTTSTQATATASAAAVTLAAGAQFHLQTCLVTHHYKAAPLSTCATKDVDTRGSTVALSVAAPSATSTVGRPSSDWTYAAAQIAIWKIVSGTSKSYAYSWPSTGLKGAGIAIPAVGATTATLPGRQGVFINSAQGDGGINSGLPDSMCSGVPKALSTAPGPGVSTTALGTGAPAYYEVGQPSGAYAGQPAKGVILLFHQGGWYGVGAGAVEDMRGEADRWRARGWLTINATYRACSYSLVDALWFYDHARTVYGTSLPYCTSGQSAGGHLALMVAALRSTVACVEDQSGPTDAAGLLTETGGDGSTQGPLWIYNLMTATFGQENLGVESPALWPLKARILAAVGATDPLIPYAQMTTLHDNVTATTPGAYVDVDRLDAGTVTWVHTTVSQAALTDLYAREQALVAPLVQ